MTTTDPYQIATATLGQVLPMLQARSQVRDNMGLVGTPRDDEITTALVGIGAALLAVADAVRALKEP
jgi:hypothetical protein